MSPKDKARQQDSHLGSTQPFALNPADFPATPAPVPAPASAKTPTKHKKGKTAMTTDKKPRKPATTKTTPRSKKAPTTKAPLPEQNSAAPKTATPTTPAPTPASKAMSTMDRFVTLSKATSQRVDENLETTKIVRTDPRGIVGFANTLDRAEKVAIDNGCAQVNWRANSFEQIEEHLQTWAKSGDKDATDLLEPITFIKSTGDKNVAFLWEVYAFIIRPARLVKSFDQLRAVIDVLASRNHINKIVNPKFVHDEAVVLSAKGLHNGVGKDKEVFMPVSDHAKLAWSNILDARNRARQTFREEDTRRNARRNAILNEIYAGRTIPDTEKLAGQNGFAILEFGRDDTVVLLEVKTNSKGKTTVRPHDAFNWYRTWADDAEAVDLTADEKAWPHNQLDLARAVRAREG